MSPRRTRRDGDEPEERDGARPPDPADATPAPERRAKGRRKERRPAANAPEATPESQPVTEPVDDGGRRRGVRKKRRQPVAPPVVPDLTAVLAPTPGPRTDAARDRGDGDGGDGDRLRDRDLVGPSGRVVLHAGAADDLAGRRPPRAAPASEVARMRAFRFPALLIIFGLLVAAVAFERRLQPEHGAVVAADLAHLAPTAAPGDALSSTWFCAGGTALGSIEAPPSATTTTTKAAGGKTPATTPGTTIPEPPAVVVAEQTIIISNQADHAQQARVTAYPSVGGPTTMVVAVDAGSRVDVEVAKMVTAPYASVLVETDGGLLGVAHRVQGPTGVAYGACATSASSSWYFPAGTTRLGTRQIFLAFNPFPERAVLDFDFQVEDEGGRQLSRSSDKLKGLVVQPDSVLAIDISDIVNVRTQIATQVHTRDGAGRVIVDRLLVGSGDHDQPRQLSLGLGAPALADTWVFGDGAPIEPGVDTTFVLFNPGTETVSADLFVDADGALPEIEPFDVTVRPGQYAAVSLTKDNRVPVGVGYWASVHSRLGGAIAVERVVTAAAPAARLGTSYALGTPVLADRWVVPVGGVPSTSELSVANVSPDQPVTLTVYLVAAGTAVPVDRFDHVSLGAGMRTVVTLGELGAVVGTTAPTDRSLRVEATGPVAVDQTFANNDPPLSSAFPPYPVRDSLRPPPVGTAAATTTIVVAPGGTVGPGIDLGTLPSGPEAVPGSALVPPGSDVTLAPGDPNAPTTATAPTTALDPNAPSTTTTVDPTATTATTAATGAATATTTAPLGAAGPSTVP